MTAYFKDIKISVSVFFAAAIMFLFIFAPDGSSLTGLFCCLAHETGHLVLIGLSGEKVKSVSFGIYGMRIETSGSLKVSHGKEALISFAGPAVNLLLISAGFAFHSVRLVQINAALAALNLMPAGKTDGWHIAYNVLIMKYGEEKTKTALNVTGAVFLGIVYFFGAVVLIKSGYNFSLIAVAAYITVIFILK